jgi:phosphate transport system permease protein
MSTATQTSTATSVDARMKRRMLTDSLFKNLMTVGGISVIVAVSAIFFYLASVVVPLFTPPSVDNRQQYATPGPADQPTLAYSGEEQREIGSRVGTRGAVTFFRFDTGAVLAETAVPVPAGVQVTSADLGERRSYSQGFGLSDGSVILVKQGFTVTYPNNKRLITPALTYPLGEAPLAVDPQRKAISLLGVQQTDDGSTIAALTEDRRLLLSAVNVTTNPMTGDTKSEIQQSEISPAPTDIRQLVIESKQRELYVLHGERSLTRYDISNKTAPKLLETVALAPEGQRITALTMLSGGFSLIVGTDKGELAQWFLVRTEGTTFKLQRIRGFKSMPAAVTALAPEFFRKGFIVGDAQGHLGSYFATSERQLFVEKLGNQPLTVLGVPPRGNGYLAQDASGKVYSAAVDNHYPEVSWHSLWEKVWYESYEGPDYVWQSSAANADFEPKFSLAPLTYGTIKAASYAMLLSVPLAVLGAVFTAYFMTQRMRTIVKPTIEVMEALPTVGAGFPGRAVAGAAGGQQPRRGAAVHPAAAGEHGAGVLCLARSAQGLDRPRGPGLGGSAADAGAGGGGLAGLSAGTPHRGRALRRRSAELPEQRTWALSTTSATAWWWVSRWVSR